MLGLRFDFASAHGLMKHEAMWDAICGRRVPVPIITMYCLGNALSGSSGHLWKLAHGAHLANSWLDTGVQLVHACVQVVR